MMGPIQQVRVCLTKEKSISDARRAFLKTPENFSGPKNLPVKLPKTIFGVSQSARTFRAREKSRHFPPIIYRC